jgi:ABC-type polar amino acid transport system ATPase subunit
MIKVTDLHKRHQDLEVLRGISMSVPKASAHVIVGPSGGGKSTFLRCINGLERFEAGSIAVGDLALGPGVADARLLEAVRKRVGFVFQQFNLFPHLDVLQNLIEAPVQVLGEDQGKAEARAMELLMRMGIAGKARARTTALSGGQQQRVAIARTLMMKPEAILFDEPTSALDPVMASEVLAVMAELAKEGQTMIVVTHSMGFARSAATCVHLFAEGHDVESGPPEKFFGAPEHPTTKAFLAKAAA